MDQGDGVDDDQLGAVFWCAIKIAVAIFLVLIPIVSGASDSGHDTPMLIAIVGGIAGGARLRSRGRSRGPIRLVGPVTLATAFAVLYPFSLAVGISISAARRGGFTWGRGLILGYGLTSLAAAIPAASVCKATLRRFALKPLAWVTTVSAVLLTPLYGLGIPLIPLAWSHWGVLRGYRRMAVSAKGTRSRYARVPGR